jgi:RNA polymerase sigma-70 factor (ECF subfamily)
VSVGDEEFDDLYRRHHGAVLRYVRRRLVTADAEDVVGEVFAVAWRRRRDMPGEAARLPWLYSTAYRVLANEYRRARRVHALAERLESRDRPGDGADLAERVSQVVDLARAFDQMTEDDKELLRLVAWEHLDTADVALVVRCSRPAAAMRIARARRRLRAQLDRPENDPRVPAAPAPILDPGAEAQR